jgi:tetratricopeptide (TPR) repeat protein
MAQGDGVPFFRRLGQGLVVGLCAVAVGGSFCKTPDNAQNPHTLRHQSACKEYLEKQDLDAAETRCKLCLEFDRPNPECLNMMGMVWYLRAQPDQARDWYKRALRSRNDFPEARNNLGVIFMEQDPPDYAEAITNFHASIKIDPSYQDGRWNLALAHSRVGNVRYADATNKLHKLGKLGTADPSELASYYAPAEQAYALADDQLRRLFELDPKSFQAYNLMGYIELQRASYAATKNRQQENFARSQDMSMRCVELAPTDRPERRECHGNLAYVLEQVGQCQAAMGHWLTCVALNPKEPECLTGFNRAYTCAATSIGALKKYIDEVRENPGYAMGHFNLCIAAFGQNIPDLAAASCENALQLDPKLCLSHYQLGRHYRTVLNQERATNHCKDFIACTGTQHPAEIQECKDLIGAVEVSQP